MCTCILLIRPIGWKCPACGVIRDADGSTFADTGGVEGEKFFIARIRGWWRISYYVNAEALQDEIGEHMAKALTEYWNKHRPA